MTLQKLVFVDIESPRNDPAIIQIAAIATDDSLNIVEEFEQKIRYSSFKEDSTLTEPLLWKRFAAPPKVAAKRFASFLSRHATVRLTSRRNGRPFHVAQLVGHNAERFDGPKLHSWFAELGVFLPAARSIICTKQRAYWYFFEHQSVAPPKDFKLRTLCDYFNVDLPVDHAHDAGHDVRAMLEFYRTMLLQYSQDIDVDVA